MPKMNLQGMPTVPIDFKPGTESAGLELVDIYLWVFKRVAVKGTWQRDCAVVNLMAGYLEDLTPLPGRLRTGSRNFR